MGTPIRTRNITTGRTRNGEPEVLQLQDDGYRIHVSWISGRPDNVDEEDNECMWAEYKHCDFPYIAQFVADLLFPPGETVKL